MGIDLLYPPHPGEVLSEEILPRYDLSITKTATVLRVKRKVLNDILKCRKPVTVEFAVRVEKVFGVSSEILMRMQTAYDIRVVRDQMFREIGELKPLRIKKK